MGATASIHEENRGCGEGFTEEVQRLHEEFQQQLGKPLGGSDTSNLGKAREEIRRLRFLLSCSNSHYFDSNVISASNNEGEQEQEEIVVPKQAESVPDILEKETIALSKALRTLGVEFSEFLETTENSGEQFLDNEFPPDKTSLAHDWDSLEDRSQWESFVWKRLDEVWKDQDPKLFAHGVSPKDVHQGRLGNCYFLSSLAVLAEYPHRVKGLFVQDQASKSGLYGIRLCHDGEWKTIPVDDAIPFSPSEGCPAFARPGAGSPEKWVCLAEKAWAKLNGSYQATIGGLTSRALRNLTGCRTETFSLEDPKSAWEALREAEAGEYLMTAEVGDHPGDLESIVGIVERHAYAILGIYEFPTPGATDRKTKLIQLRNPWGRVEWNGDWSDHSSLWTEEIKALVGWSAVDDGIFHMSLQDFSKVFDSVVICYVKDNLVYSCTKPVPFTNNSLATSNTVPLGMLSPFRRACVKITISQKGKYTIGVHQRDLRSLQVTDPKASSEDYDGIKFWIVKLPGSDSAGFATVAASEWINYRDLYVADQEFSPGEYLLFAQCPKMDADERVTFVVSTNGPASTGLEVVHSGMNQLNAMAEGSSWSETSKLLLSAYENWCVAAGKSSNYARVGQPQITKSSWTTQQEGVVAFVYENHGTKTLHETLSFNISNLAFVHLHNATQMGDANQVSVTVEPGQRAVIVLEQILEYEPYRYGYRSSFYVQ